MAIVPVMKPAWPVARPAEAAATVKTRTEQATQALQAVDITPKAPERVRGSTVRMSIPLDSAERPATDSEQPRPKTPTQVHTTYGQHKLIRRDSLDRREALLKGKEGSRQRRRWENDRLMNNPWATPPLPSDWEVRPTYPIRSVPYYLAPLWDAAEFQRSVEEKMSHRKGKAAYKRGRSHMTPAEEAASNVPKEVRAKLKRARAAKGLLMDLEEQVRLFLQRWGEKEERKKEEGLADADSEEEEIVFVGRNGVMHDSPGRKQKEEAENVARQKMLFDGLEDDKGASFGRWLVHSIATYYGLQTWSVTTGDPARREAYVGVGDRRTVLAETKLDLPRPLYGMV